MEQARDAQQLIQSEFESINPVVGGHTKMREQGIAADALTIDCLSTGKRISVIILDDNPEQALYLFGDKTGDSNGDINSIHYDSITKFTIYEWIKEYFVVND